MRLMDGVWNDKDYEEGFAEVEILFDGCTSDVFVVRITVRSLISASISPSSCMIFVCTAVDTGISWGIFSCARRVAFPIACCVYCVIVVVGHALE